MGKYQIKSVSIHCGNMPVNAHFSYGSACEFPFVIVKISTDEFQGIGETLVQWENSFVPFAKNLIGNDVRKLDSLLLEWKTEFQRRFCEALSIALYDLLGHISDLPLWALFGGKQRDEIPLMPCIFPMNPGQAKQMAAEYAAQGCKFLKTKLIGDIQEDVARIKAIRSVFSSGLHLQGDSNEGYKTIDSAAEAVMRLGDVGLDFFEDPLKGGPEEYRQLCDRTKGRRSKITVDLLARSMSDLSAVLQLHAADAVSLHPCQMGSLSSALRHVILVKAYSLSVILAGTGFTGIGTAAWQHLTAVASAESPSGELGGFVDHSMPDSLVIKPLAKNPDKVTLPDQPGLGVALDSEVLAKYQALNICLDNAGNYCSK